MTMNREDLDRLYTLAARYGIKIADPETGEIITYSRMATRNGIRISGRQQSFSQAMLLRNAEIADSARRGERHKTIAQRLGISESRVGAIVAAAKRHS